MVALLAALVLAAPPKATITTAAGRYPLAISSWCWRSHCGAPFTAARATAVAARGSLVTVELAFAPRHATVAVAGQRVLVLVHGDEVSWRAERGGGLTVHVTSARGWVTYVVRLRLA